MRTKYFLFFGVLATFAGCFNNSKEKVELKVDEKTPEESQIAYALGVQYAKGMTDLEFNKSQQEHFLKGISDYFAQKPQIANNNVQALSQKADQIRAKKRLEDSASERKIGEDLSQKILREDTEFQKLENGIIYKITKPGQVVSNSKSSGFVGMKYESSKLNGDVYESTLSGNPRNLPLKGIFKAWQEAFKIVGTGGEIIIISPPEFTYGSNGAMPYVKPGEYLKFKIQFFKYYETNPQG